MQNKIFFFQEHNVTDDTNIANEKKVKQNFTENE